MFASGAVVRVAPSIRHHDEEAANRRWACVEGARRFVLSRRFIELGQAELDPCACRKSNPDILVMQPAQDRTAKNVTNGSDGARYGRILI